MDKLSGLPAVRVGYRKPGVNLTAAIAAALTPRARVVQLDNHGLIVAADTVDAVAGLMDEVEARLAMPVLTPPPDAPADASPPGFAWLIAAAPLATDARLCALAQAGSYYPDHVVFLVPALGATPVPTGPAVVVPGTGAAIRTGATSAQRAMLVCLADVLTRLPPDWDAAPIGPDAERGLLNWDAEKYRQALARRNAAP